MSCKGNYRRVSSNVYERGGRDGKGKIPLRESDISCKCSECGATVYYRSGEVYKHKLWDSKICNDCYFNLGDEEESVEADTGGSLVGCFLIVVFVIAAFVIGAMNGCFDYPPPR